jgi:uncharacterized membrane protein YraQ (UPF0718 family)
MAQLHIAFTLFLSLLVEAMPFLLLGVLLSSALLFWVDERRLVSILPRNPILGAFVGSCFGFLFPVCECGNVPVARRLLIQGVPSSVAIGFLLAAPTINPVVIWSTWVAFRDQPVIVVLRVVFSLVIATIIGCVFSIQKDPRVLLESRLAKRLPLPVLQGQGLDGTPILLQSGSFLLGQSGKAIRLTPDLLETAIPAKGRLRERNQSSGWRTRFFFFGGALRMQLFLDNLTQELRELGGVLILGSALAAIIQVFVPREFILNLGQGTISSIVAMLILAGIVSICSTVDSFFALSFASTFTSSSLLAFLVFGPMIDIKGVGLMLSIFKPRMIFYLFALAAQLTFILVLGYSYFA